MPSRGTRTWDIGDSEESLLCQIKSTQQDPISGGKSQASNSPKLEAVPTIFHRHFYGVQIFDQNAKNLLFQELAKGFNTYVVYLRII